MMKTKIDVNLNNGFQSLTIITKGSILDVAAVLDPPLEIIPFSDKTRSCIFGHV